MELETHTLIKLIFPDDESVCKLEPEQKFTISFQMLEVFNYLHDRRVIYIDMKPDNVLVGFPVAAAAPHAKLCDFASAHEKKHDEFQMQKTRQDLESITYHYAPPELLRREGYGVESSDIWSLGATLAVMFSESFVWFDTPDDAKAERLELLNRLKAGKNPDCLRKLRRPLRKALHGCFKIDMHLRPSLQQLKEQLLSAKTST